MSVDMCSYAMSVSVCAHVYACVHVYKKAVINYTFLVLFHTVASSLHIMHIPYISS